MFQNIIEFVNNYLVLSITWLFSLILMIVFIYKDKYTNIQLITVIELVNLINNKNAIILDFRTQDQYSKGHIINSLNISLKIKDKKKDIQLKKFRNQPVVIIFKDSNIDKSLVNYLNSIDLNKIYILQGGMYSWNQERYPIVVSD